MDLKDYQNRIKQALLSGQYNEMKVNKRIKGGGSKINQKPQASFDRQPACQDNINEYKNVRELYVPTRQTRPRIARKTKNVMDDMEDLDTVNNGGNFMKSFKKAFKPLTHTVVQETNNVGKVLVSKGAKALEKKGLNAIEKFGETALKQAPTVIAENPELLAMGMTKKPRKQSDRMKRRGELIRKLMNQNHMTLPEASRHIAEQNIKY